MASLYKRKGSPYWWIKKTVASNIVRESTGLRYTLPKEGKKARSQCALETSKELGAVGAKESEKFDAWVPAFLDTHCEHDLTLGSYVHSWSWLAMYLADHRILTPRQLTYQHAFDFIAWRTAQGVKKSTALRDLKVLRLLMRHAVRRGMAVGNPCDRMGIDRPMPKVKSELSDQDIRKIYDGLEGKPSWMRFAFSVCLHTGCRIGEADPKRMDIDFTRKTITFSNPKGGIERAFTTVLTSELATIIKDALKANGAVDMVTPKTASQVFSKFFRQIGLKGITIHCTRVTFISRLARSGVPERVARLAVNHASASVHRSYQRLQVEDVRQIEGKLNFPAPNRT